MWSANGRRSSDIGRRGGVSGPQVQVAALSSPAMLERFRPSPLALAALVAGLVGYVLTFYVRSAFWPWVGAVLMLLAPFLAVAAIAASPRRLTTIVALLAVVPLAAFIWALWALLSS